MNNWISYGIFVFPFEFRFHELDMETKYVMPNNTSCGSIKDQCIYIVLLDLFFEGRSRKILRVIFVYINSYPSMYKLLYLQGRPDGMRERVVSNLLELTRLIKKIPWRRLSRILICSFALVWPLHRSLMDRQGTFHVARSMDTCWKTWAYLLFSITSVGHCSTPSFSCM